MEITQAEFVSSYADVRKCPPPDKPEFAFIGRSNVGKSSLINMLTGRKKLAKTSVKPGKTQTINHYLINGTWYLVDLPGYGYASASKEKRAGFGKIIEDYVLKRENIDFLFILIDCRLEPQTNDLSFINWAGEKGVPLGIVFTKTDKVSRNELQKNIAQFKKALLTSWDDLPPVFITSSSEKKGKQDVLDFIQNTLAAQH